MAGGVRPAPQRAGSRSPCGVRAGCAGHLRLLDPCVHVGSADYLGLAGQAFRSAATTGASTGRGWPGIPTLAVRRPGQRLPPGGHGHQQTAEAAPIRRPPPLLSRWPRLVLCPVLGSGGDGDGDRVRGRPAAAGRDRLRAGHADREQVIKALKDAFVAGRLTRGEPGVRAARRSPRGPAPTWPPSPPTYRPDRPQAGQRARPPRPGAVRWPGPPAGSGACLIIAAAIGANYKQPACIDSVSHQEDSSHNPMPAGR